MAELTPGFLDPDTLDDILEVLSQHGVTQFSCPAFSVTLSGAVAPTPKTPDPDIAKALARRETEIPVKGMYAHKSLWPDGKPPAFPGRERPSIEREETD